MNTMNGTGLALTFPEELVDAIADRVADRLAGVITPDNFEGYLNVGQAAEYLACPTSRIYDLRGSGRLRAHRDGSRLLFTRAELDAALTPP